MEIPINLEEVDSLEAIVIIDNELDPLSPPAPGTVQISGNLGSIAMGSKHTLTDRGEACKELRLEDVCCAAHGLSILVVRRYSAIGLLEYGFVLSLSYRLPLKATRSTLFSSMPVLKRRLGRET